jgi:eukaryotic-like serine/threonine-protein kinase
MNAEVTLTIMEGANAGKEYIFRGRTLLSVGRGTDCLLQLPNDIAHLNVSRHHCVFDIDPPEVRVRDLGSRNGTHVNGKNIGQRTRGQSASESAADMSDWILEDGDEVRVGYTVFRVHISSGEMMPAEHVVAATLATEEAGK